MARKTKIKLEEEVIKVIALKSIRLTKDFNSRTKDNIGMTLDSLRELGASIFNDGQVQPGIVEPHTTKGSYLLIAGARRLMAIQLWNREHPGAGDQIPGFKAVVRDMVGGLEGLDVEQVAAAKEKASKDRHVLNLIENVQRVDLSAFEKARALSRLATDFGMSSRDVEARTGMDRATVEMYLKIADPEKLPETLAKDLEKRGVGVSTAAKIADIKDAEDPEDFDKNLALKKEVVKSCLETGEITRERVSKNIRERKAEGEAAAGNKQTKVGMKELRDELQGLVDSYHPEDAEAGGVSHSMAAFVLTLGRYLDGRLRWNTFHAKVDAMLKPIDAPKPKAKRKPRKKVEAEADAEAEA